MKGVIVSLPEIVLPCYCDGMAHTPITIQRESNPYGKGWTLTIRFGSSKPFRRGAGYRAWDFPWHSSSIHSPSWRTRRWFSYIPGYTLRVIRQAKVYRDPRGSGSDRRALWVQLTSNGNARLAVPQWWS